MAAEWTARNIESQRNAAHLEDALRFIHGESFDLKERIYGLAPTPNYLDLDLFESTLSDIAKAVSNAQAAVLTLRELLSND